MPRLLFIVPAYNEEASVGEVVRALRERYPAAGVLVVNDGSSDRTSAIAREHGAIVLDLPFNLGIGTAVQSGLMYAMEHRYELAVQFDGDGQHPVAEIETLLAPVERDQCDVAIGSRYVAQSGYQTPVARRTGIRILSFVTRLLVRKRVTDPTSGFRALNGAAIDFLAREYPHDYPEPESIIALCRNGFRIMEVKVEMRRRQGGQSSITFLRAIYYMVKVLFGIVIGVTRTARRSNHNEQSNPDSQPLHRSAGDVAGRSTHP